MSWKKGFTIVTKVFLVGLGILFLLFSIRQVTMIWVTGRLHKVAETDHFVFYATDEDKGLYSSGFLADRDLTFDRISSDLNYQSDQKIIHRLFPSMRLLHLSWGNPFEWPVDSVGNSFILEIRELSPYSADWIKYPKISDSNIFAHELTHVMTGEINPDRHQTWLIEGLAVYEQTEGRAGPYFKTLLHEHVVQDEAPDLNQLTGQTLWNFIEKHGYDYGYTVVEYVVQSYGKDKLAELARTAADSDTYFGMSAADFWEGWMVYLKENY